MGLVEELPMFQSHPLTQREQNQINLHDREVWQTHGAAIFLGFFAVTAIIVVIAGVFGVWMLPTLTRTCDIRGGTVCTATATSSVEHPAASPVSIAQQER